MKRIAKNAQGHKVIGNATIYLPKDVLKENDSDPEKGFNLIIRPK